MWDAEVVDIDVSSKNRENPVFLSFIIPMKKNMKLKYVEILNNWLQIKSVDLTNDDISFDFEV